MFAKVVLKDSTSEFDREYLYKIPEEFPGMDLQGSEVIIPFGTSNRHTVGYITETDETANSPFYVKEIISFVHPFPVLKKYQLDLAKHMRKKYLCTWGDAIRLMIPPHPAPREKTSKTAYLKDPDQALEMLDDGEISHINQVRVIRFLLEYEESFTEDIMLGCKVGISTLNTLRKKGILEFGKKTSDKEIEYESTDFTELEKPFVPGKQQQDIIDKVLGSEDNTFREFLIHGITGSGKTEVYMHIVKNLIEKGKGAIFLVPEISLTPQMITRLENRFGNNVRVMHSRLTPKQRYEHWKDILSGDANIVVGARSAVFAPVKNPGIIIIDEEQETSYKSQTHPGYDAGYIARIRMYESKGILITGSATPKVETYHRALTGKSTLLKLTERTKTSKLPSITVADMKEELASGNKSIFSRALNKEMKTAFSKGEQVILFINRRGYNGFYLCRECGYVPECSSCSVSLTYHLTNKSLLCHYCGKIHKLPEKCPECGSRRIGGFGAGTQKIQEQCEIQFPDRKVLRMDQDTTVSRGSHEKILKDFQDRKADILIGTQMIAKGHDYENVTVVGIIAADMILGMSDFRASERTFQLITQAAGRAGRGDKEGKVIVQAYNTDEYSIVYSSKQDYEGFYNEEITFRKAMGYPPFKAIGLVIISADKESKAREAAYKIRRELILCAKEGCVYPYEKTELEVMEVSKAPVSKIRDRYRYRIILKGENEKILSVHFARISSIKLEKNVFVSMDINPFQLN